MKKLRLGDFFVSYGWLIPVFLIVCLICWYWPLTAVNAIQDYEKISLFAECYEFTDETLQDDLYAELHGYGVEEVDISAYSPNSSMINSYYTAFGESADILLLTKSSCDNNLADSEIVLADWIEYGDGLCSLLGLPEDAVYYEIGGGNYAVMVYNAYSRDYAIDFSGFGSFLLDGAGEDVYMLLRATSPNFGEYSDEGTTENGIRAVRFLLERYSS